MSGASFPQTRYDELMRQRITVQFVGVLLLWLSAWPWNFLRTEVADLPQQPSFTLSHLLLLVGAVILTLGAATIAVRPGRGRPDPGWFDARSSCPTGTRWAWR